MSFKSFLLFFLLAAAATVSALATPHNRISHNHRAIAARVLPKRADGKRCRSRPVSSSSAPLPPVNAAPTPSVKADPTTSSTVERPTTTPKPPPPPPSSTAERPTTSAKPPPPPSPTPKPTTTSTPPKPAPTTSDTPAPPPPPTKPSSGNDVFTGTQTGQGTFYDTGLGACGITNTDSDPIVAVSHLLFDKFPGYDGGNPNKNPICGKKVRATFQGKSVTVTITDRCVGCAITDLDFSPSAFSVLAAFSIGRISGMTWVWV